jgi:quaternary ammonium compound-resistance protein SugE
MRFEWWTRVAPERAAGPYPSVAAGDGPGNRGTRIAAAAAQCYDARMAWLFVIVAGVLEVVWAFAMKQSAGFTKPFATAVTVVTLIASLALLSISMRTLPLGTAYGVWTGIGAIGAFIVGVVVLGEAMTPLRVAAAVLIASGLVVMKVASPD